MVCARGLGSMMSVDLPALYRLGILSAKCWAVARWPARRTALYVLYVAGYQTADWFRAALLLFPPDALGVPFSLLLVLLSERSHGLRCLSPCSRIAQAWSCPSTAHQTKDLATIADPCPVTSWRYQGCPCLMSRRIDVYLHLPPARRRHHTPLFLAFLVV